MYTEWTAMARKKRGEVKRMPIDLDMNDADQKALWDYWQELSNGGTASKWVRDTLIRALPKAQSTKVPILAGRPFTPSPKPSARVNGHGSTKYEDIDE